MYLPCGSNQKEILINNEKSPHVHQKEPTRFCLANENLTTTLWNRLGSGLVIGQFAFLRRKGLRGYIGVSSCLWDVPSKAKIWMIRMTFSNWEFARHTLVVFLMGIQNFTAIGRLWSSNDSIPVKSHRWGMRSSQQLALLTEDGLAGLWK